MPLRPVKKGKPGPPFFTLPREIRNRIYFWIAAKDLNFSRELLVFKRGPARNQPCFNPRAPGFTGMFREGIAAQVLSNPKILRLLLTSRAFMAEFIEELSFAVALPPAVETRCEELHVYGVGAPGSRHLVGTHILLLELFLRYIMPGVPLVVVHCSTDDTHDTPKFVLDHFRAHGAKQARRDEIKVKVPGIQKMAVPGHRHAERNWYGQTTVLSGVLNDFLRPELRLPYRLEQAL